MRLGKFPNKLRYFLSANTRAPSVPASLLCLPCLPALRIWQCKQSIVNLWALQPSQTPHIPFSCRVDDGWKSVELMNRASIMLIFIAITAQHILNKVLTKRERANVPACRPQQLISIVELLLRIYITHYHILNACIQQFIRITVYLMAETVAHVSCMGTY